MSMKDRLVEQGKKLASSGPVVRLISNDGVMRVATGVMDARSRFQAAAEHASEAWNVLVNGHALPTIDPALEGDTEAKGDRAPVVKTNGAAARPVVAEAPSESAPAPKPAASSAPANGSAEQKLASQMASRGSLSRIGGKDVF